MNWKKNVLTVAALALLALRGYSQPAPSGAQPPKGSTGASAHKRTAMLLSFIHKTNSAEIEMANLAKQNSNSPQVKNFADQIIKDHKAEEEKILKFADSHNIDLVAAGKQLRTAIDKAADDSVSRGVGSEPGEWAWWTEPGTGTGGSGLMKTMANHEQEMDKLSTLKGAEFDREFAKAMVNDHQAIINHLTFARTKVSDPDAVALVDKALPTAKRHLTTAQKLQAAVSKS
jgi:predicted outer membrane protein